MEISSSLVVFAVLLVITIAALNGITASQGDTINVLNNYTMNYTENPHDGDTVLLDSHIYEFDDNGNTTIPNIPVVIDSDVGNTCNNLRYAIKDHSTIKVS